MVECGVSGASLTSGIWVWSPKSLACHSFHCHSNKERKVKPVIGNKDRQILVRVSDYENRRAKYIARRCGISVAEVFRISLRVITQDLQPSQVPQFKKLYEKEETRDG